jgi:hypothetical protein
MTAIDAASCDAQSALAKPEPIPVQVSPMTPERIVAKRPGTATWRWGYHFASNDPRVGQVTGLTVDAKLGLIATTADHNWLVLDFGSHDDLAAVKAIRLAPMRGASGRPAAITGVVDWQLVSFSNQNVVLRYSTATCGTGALGVPVFNTKGMPSATTVVQAADSYIVLAGEVGKGIKNSDLLLPYDLQNDVTLTLGDIPALHGYRLLALANAARIVPDIFALWAAPGRDTVLQEIFLPAWGDVHISDDRPEANEIARLPRTPTGMTAVYQWSDQHTVLLLTFDAGPNAVDVAAIDIAR